MRRFWIFLLVGPFIAFVGAFFCGAAEWMSAGYLVVFLVIVYVAGAVPALLTCLVDHLLSDKVGSFKRAGITALAGCVFVVAAAAIYFEGFDWNFAILGIVGAVAALVCSLLSAEAA